jgi:hypothetical protein
MTDDTIVKTAVFSSGGSKLDDLSVDLSSVLWRLGQTGQARFSISYEDEKATRENIRPSNRFLVQFASGLPDWGGVIDLPLGRGDTGLDVTVYEGDRLLDWRVTGADVAISSTAPGAIAQALVQAAKETWPLGIVIGDVYAGGSQSQEYHYDNLLAEVRSLATGYDYAVVPSYQDGQLLFYLHWYARRGVDRRNSVHLVEGKNIDRPRMDEQGPLYNRVIVVGSGVTWADRPTVIAEDLDSRYQYDLREYPKIYSDIADEVTLQELADALLAEMKYPRVRGTIPNVTNRDPAWFDDYDVGDIVTLRAYLDAGEDWVFDGPVRILSREWSPAGYCTLEVEEWRD